LQTKLTEFSSILGFFPFDSSFAQSHQNNLVDSGMKRKGLFWKEKEGKEEEKKEKFAKQK